MFIRFILTAALLFGSATLSQAQSPVAQREAIKKLDFLVGEWKGEGWMEFVAGQRRTFKGSEVVQSKLDGMILTVEGIHRVQLAGKSEEIVVHNAFGLLTYDDKAKRYRFQGLTARGNHEDTEAKVTDGQLTWGIKVDKFGDAHYTVKKDDKGRWHEIGEVSTDGKEWRKFMEMTLERVEKK